MTTSPLMDTKTEHDAQEQDTYIFPTTFAQQGLWFLSRLEPESTAYNLFSAVRLTFTLQQDVLEESLQELVRRHEVLRTTFTVRDGQPMQVVSPTLALPFSVTSLSNLEEGEQEAEVLRLATGEARQLFDLERGPLWRVKVLTLDTEHHLLFFTIHHSISDGWSTGIFFRELAEAYTAFVQQCEPSLPELPLQYADFAIWQREWLQEEDEDLKAHLDYWKEQLSGVSSVLELPTDRPRSAVPTSQGATYLFTLPRPLVDALKAFSRQEGVTLYMTLVAAFQVLLYRYSGQDDFMIGSTSAGRSEAETEQLIGLFVNTLVLRTHMDGNPSFRELLHRVREDILAAHEHQDVPFEYLVKEFQPQRNLGQNPLFQVLLSLVPSLSGLPTGWTPVQLDVHTGSAKFDLSLEIEERPEGLVGQLEYRTALFERETIVRLVEHWQTLLQSVMAQPELPISVLPLLTEAEQQQLNEWNATATEYPRNSSLHELFAVQAQRTPEETALLYQGQRMTYGELEQRSNQLARHLQQLGVTSGSFVGLCVERSPEMVVAMLAILKAGAAYLPLDPSYPLERLIFMLEDAQPAVLVTQQKLRGKLSVQTQHIVCLDTDWPAIARQSTVLVSSDIGGEDVAYLIYTSGSVGRPKGVLGTHRATINRCHWMWTTYPFTPDEVCCQKTALSFVDSIWEIFGPLLQGIPSVIIADDVVRDPERFVTTLATHKVTRLVLVPSLLRALLETRPDLAQKLSHLRYCISSGEVLPLDVAQQFVERMPHTVLLNLYGSSEVAADATYYEVSSQQPVARVLIGRPIANMQAYVLDSHMQTVPIGIPGELYIGGDGLAKGYFNRPELTAQRFVSNPFSADPVARLYKTGDSARRLPDGSLEYVGRLDHQIKLRGYRIEPGEIEAVLCRHPAVHQAVVVLREDNADDKQLVAYVVRHDNMAASVPELQKHMAAHLPAYMVPATSVILDAFPLTPNGKIDRKALPAPTRNTHEDKDRSVAPPMTVHHRLTQIWEEVLNVHPIGLKDDFFALGGHSLLVIRLFDRIEKVFGKKLSPAVLYDGATIEHLADIILGGKENRSRALVVAVQTGSPERQPFFFLHGDWYGGGFYCLELSRYLGEQQPFYVLEPYTFDGLKVVPSFKAMAAAHIEAMRTVQPKGPYLLGGFCNGALMAYEIACQLHAEGQKVELLAMIDPANPLPHKWVRLALETTGMLLGVGEDKQMDTFLRYIYARIPSYRERVEESRRLKYGEQLVPLHRDEEDLLAPFKFPPAEDLRLQWSGIYRWVVADYRPGPYPGKMVHLWSSENVVESVDWRKISKSAHIEKHIFSGTHMSCRKENLHIVAARLRLYLEEAQAEIHV